MQCEVVKVEVEGECEVRVAADWRGKILGNGAFTGPVCCRGDSISLLASEKSGAGVDL